MFLQFQSHYFSDNISCISRITLLLLFTVFSIWIDRFKVPDDKGVNCVTNSGVWVLSLRNYDGKIDVLRTNSHPTHFTHPKQPTRHYSGNIKFIFERDQILIYLVHEKNKMLESSFIIVELHWKLGHWHILFYLLLFPG